MKIRHVIQMDDDIIPINRKERKCDECGRELETITVYCEKDEQHYLCGNCLINVGNLLLGV